MIFYYPVDAGDESKDSFDGYMIFNDTMTTINRFEGKSLPITVSGRFIMYMVWTDNAGSFSKPIILPSYKLKNPFNVPCGSFISNTQVNNLGFKLQGDVCCISSKK